MVALHEVADVLPDILAVLAEQLGLEDVGEQAVRVVLVDQLLGNQSARLAIAQEDDAVFEDDDGVDVNVLVQNCMAAPHLKHLVHEQRVLLLGPDEPVEELHDVVLQLFGLDLLEVGGFHDAVVQVDGFVGVAENGEVSHGGRTNWYFFLRALNLLLHSYYLYWAVY